MQPVYLSAAIAASQGTPDCPSPVAHIPLLRVNFSYVVDIVLSNNGTLIPNIKR